MNKPQHSHWGRIVALLFIFFQIVQIMPLHYFMETASAAASGTETIFADENGRGEAEWDLSDDGKTIIWNLTVSKSASEADATPYIELTSVNGIEPPVIQSATLNGTTLTGASFKETDNKYFYHSEHFISEEQTLKLTITSTVTDQTSASIPIKIGAGIIRSDAESVVSSKNLTLPNRLAQLEAERLAAEEAAKKAEADRTAAEEAAKKEAEDQAKESSGKTSESSKRPKEDAAEKVEVVDSSQREESEKESAEEPTKTEEDSAEEDLPEEEIRYMEGSSKIPYTGGPVTEDGVQEVGPQPVELMHEKMRAAQAAAQITYTSNHLGTFPSSFIQSGPNVRNHRPQPIEYEEGKLKKTVAETNVPGKFEIMLEVEGKSVTETETTDIVLVLDNSNSMADNDRVTIASNAARQFINGLLNDDTNPNGAIRMALVTYGSEIFANRTRTNLTDRPQLLTSRLPSHANNGDDGGTFTQAALRQARIILNGSPASNKIIIVLSDGLPTLSYVVNGVSSNSNTPSLVNYHSLSNFYTRKGISMDYDTIKGDGTGYYLEEPQYSWWTGRLLNPTHSWYNINGYQIRDHFLPTMSEALLAKQAGMTLYGVGIELAKQGTGSGSATREQALNVMKNIATNDNYYYDASQVSQIQEILEQLSYNVTKSISNGTIVDPMGGQVLLDKGSNNSFDSNDYTLEASNPSLLNGVTVSENEDGTIDVKGVNLGKDEWVRVKYNVRLNTEDPAFKPDFYYQTNGRTTLTPVANTPDLKRDFPIPSVKAPGWTLEGQKVWQEDTPADRPNRIQVTLSRKSEGTSRTQEIKTLTVTPGQDWRFTFDSLPRFDNRGRTFLYSIEETPIYGYLSSVTSVTQNPKDASKLAVTVTNTLLKGGFVLQKVDGSGEPITGSDRTAQFELKKGGELIQTIETNPETGQIVFSDLKLGTYTIRETKPPAGYEGDPKEVTVEIKQDQDGSVRAYVNGKVLDTPLLFVNHLKEGSLTIEKIDASTGETLSGATFELRNGDGEVIQTGSTNSDGKIMWGTIPFGEYTLVETKAPDGYMLQEQAHHVTIDDDTPHVRLSIENRSSAELPDTGSMGTTLFTLIGLALMGTTLYGWKKNKQKDEL